MLKKTTLAVFVLALSGVAGAGTMGPTCAPGHVTVPCEAKLWDVGVQALYLRQIHDADKAYQHDVLPFNGYREATNEWDWGYRLAGSYHFNTGNDVTMTWIHYTNNSNPDGFVGLIPFSPLLPPLSSSYSLQNTTYFNQVNLVVGEHTDFGLVKHIRFYGGLQYASVDSQAIASYSQSPVQLVSSGVTAIYQYDKSDFNGVGPVAGIDYSYDLTSSFSLTANAAGSILYGTTRLDNEFTGKPVGIVLADRYGSKKAIVPSMEVKLGVNYVHALAQGQLNLEGGYQLVNYFNALQSLGIDGYTTNRIVSSDYALSGPYFGVKYLGNA
ncbi:Lpg1974 family pore-forming outer membrane protein [Legionella worsleiensis]|uniref:Outer membrane protein n=1 Tax=Legionella worsleiensis TaxID=45076 RepID=A0A0W1AEG6_9GAMM|nr:Lpg1974 family pore-forming outer membrane protein [Legionella worsleiensis]KTD79724.1 outer membrane protein [Legionella worsleiensis]STY32235.1 major outer membrane protein [Legionella worsleiensis]